MIKQFKNKSDTNQEEKLYFLDPSMLFKKIYNNLNFAEAEEKIVPKYFFSAEKKLNFFALRVPCFRFSPPPPIKTFGNFFSNVAFSNRNVSFCAIKQ